MEDAKNTDCCSGDCICRNVWRPADDQFAGDYNSANTTVRSEIY